MEEINLIKENTLKEKIKKIWKETSIVNKVGIISLVLLAIICSLIKLIGG